MGTIVFSAKTTVTPASWGSLANAAYACSASQTVDTTKATTDILITPKIVTGTFTPSTSTLCGIYVVGSLDGTTWPDGITPDGVVTVSANGSNVTTLWAASIACPVSGGTQYGSPISLAKMFGGSIPPYFAVVLTNSTGAALGTGSAFDFEQVSYA